MSKKKVIALSVAGAAVLGAAVVISVQAFTSQGDVAAQGPSEPTVGTVEPKAPANTEDSHALPELSQKDIDRQIADGTLLVPGEVPAKVQSQAVELGKLWVTFDSRDSDDVRQAQLSKVIPNAADWVELPAELVAPDDVGWGDPTAYAVSTSTTEPAPFEPWTFSMEGLHNVAVQIPVSAKYFSGNNAMRATLDDTLVFQFKFDAAGNLVEVTPPE